MKGLPNQRGRLKEEALRSRASKIMVRDERTFIMVEAANPAELIYRDEFVGGGSQTFVAIPID